MAKRDDDKPDSRIVIKPATALTHQELLIDFVDMPPDTEFSVNVTGPIAQPYWANLKSDGTGHAQLFWRTQAPGDYKVAAKGDDVKVDASFTVSRQAGELFDELEQAVDADVKTVEEPGRMGDVSSAEAKAPEDPDADPAFKPALGPSEVEDDQKKAAARRKTTSRKGK